MHELNTKDMAVRQKCLAAFFIFGYESYPF